MSVYIILNQGSGNEFYKRIRAEELAKLKGIPFKCQKCGAKELPKLKHYGKLTIDHKLPKSKNPKSRAMLSNFQILCALCNERKSDIK